MKTLSLCMIVKDGEKYIEKCLESVFDIAEEIIIVDTGSQDNTLEFVKRFNPKIYQYEWNNNFADARNFSLQHAKGDFILVLDADEVIYPEDSQKLIEIINNTFADGIFIRFHNYTVEDSEEVFTMHLGLRVFKNGCFKYTGEIHEQLSFVAEDKNLIPMFENSNIRIKHYGYLPSNSGEKKRSRNMAILEKLLAENPDNNFHLFNMGNEYMCLGDLKTALEYYEKVDIETEKNIRLAYSPHLIFRRAICLNGLNRNDESLAVLSKGLEYYPVCTDFEFFKGTIFKKTNRFTLALESFDKCIEMGEAPPELNFSVDVFNFKPLIGKAEVYYMLEDYSKALDCYLKALSINQQKYYLIYNICDTLNNIFSKSNKNEVYKNLCNLFADSGYQPNVMVITDALLNEKLFLQADTAFEKFIGGNSNCDNNKNLDADIYFLRGRLLFYKKDYESAFNAFCECIKLQTQTSKGILHNTAMRSHEYMLACSLICDNLREKFLEFSDKLDDSDEKKVYMAFHKKYCDSDSIDSGELSRIKSILTKILSVGEYDVFEKSLEILNLVDSVAVLTALAEVYFKTGFKDMAVKTVIRSVKELDYIDSASVFILNKEFES